MEPSDIVLLALGVVCPPGAVALKRGLNRDFIICVGLTLLFWIPGVAYSWYLVFKHPLENFWERRMSAQYVSIEEGLRRHSVASMALSEDEGSRSTTMTSESAVQNQSTQASHGRKPRRGRKSSAGSRNRSGMLNDAARSYALRQQQRQEANSVKKWFVDRFYFSDPTQVPPSDVPSSELRDLDTPQ
ncbi:hypothetical protein LPJ77_003344 [Coemansia sp. RSA 2523]|nr:hypothetical protein LPJ54_002923 [Coemansia sp. RSA 1824]KAJ1790066.1 hypothetical protein LPJ62_002119 [Coemansia sp. RSA 2167]KAJ1806896.1 hypothetical protein LPJ77_003344 [Coemansia sp. RSA 2523]KAJ2143585.1 hypothetical protein J3F82_005229 [Coemansia sp. RSA 637]KAJ2146653.1 hypothetical protein IW142_001974 [Coemansia sp. RSA 564]KAJ2168364.1 hypothetical protein GGH15_001432 [Coemansia sp. RSA 562]KAJ2528642.1 hypothetical protein IWW43_005317 [Coemansia sp. RSA 1935]KAJ2554350.1